MTIFGERYPVVARVEIMDSFSAHGDYREMLHFLSCQNPAQVKTVFLVHGEYDKQLIWKGHLQMAGFQHIDIPEMGQKVTL